MSTSEPGPQGSQGPGYGTCVPGIGEPKQERTLPLERSARPAHLTGTFHLGVRVGLQTSAGPSPIIKVSTWGKDIHLLPDWTPGFLFPRVGRGLGLEEAWTYLSSSAWSSFPSMGLLCSVGPMAGARDRFSWCAENTPDPPVWAYAASSTRKPGFEFKILRLWKCVDAVYADKPPCPPCSLPPRLPLHPPQPPPPLCASSRVDAQRLSTSRQQLPLATLE